MYSNGKTNSKGGKDNFDVVFMVDEINYTDEELSAICEKIYDVSKAVFNASANVTVRVYGLNGKNKQTCCDFYGRTDTVNGLESILKKVSHTELSSDDLVDISRATSISEAVDYVALSYIISNIDDDQFKDNFNFGMNFSEAVKKASELGIQFNHEEYGFIFFNADRTNCNINGFETLFSIGSNSYNIKQSIVSNVAGIENKDEYKYSYARVLFDETEGKNFDIAANREVFVEDVIKYIYGKVPTEAGTYDAIIATGYHTIVLDKPLTEHDMELAEKRFDDPNYIFVYSEIKNCADTYKDGLYDFEEVMFFNKKLFKHKLIKFKNNEIQLPNVNTILNALNGLAYVDDGLEKAREQYGDCWGTFLAKPVLPINSHPTSADGDSDGIIDIKDVSPLSNKQNVKYSQNLYKDNSSKFTYDQQFNMNFTWLFEDCTKYNRNLALALIIYAGLAYHTTYVYGPFLDNNTPVSDSVSKTDGEYYYAMEYSDGEMLILPQVMELYGFEKNSIETINLRNCKDDKDNYYNDNHYIQFDIGKKDISQYNKNAATNTPRNVVGIFVRGTHGTPEWYSNFDIGNTDEFHKNTDWRTKENHMGFDIAAVRAKKEIDTYLSSHDLNKDNTVIWLAGHSRGAAVSGIIATYLIADGYKVFAYNFATPNQVEVADSSKIKFVECPGVFNIINADDLVPCLPLEGWNFVKYGENIYHESLSENQRKEWAKKDIYAVDNIIYDIDLKHAEYDNAPKALKFTLDSFNKICNKRNDCFSPSEGDEYILYVNDELKSILEEVDPQFKYFSLKNDKKGEYIYQRPIVFMQILAGVAASDSHFNSILFGFGCYTADHFDGAAMSMAIYSLKSGMMNPHYVDGYIILCE